VYVFGRKRNQGGKSASHAASFLCYFVLCSYLAELEALVLRLPLQKAPHVCQRGLSTPQHVGAHILCVPSVVVVWQEGSETFSPHPSTSQSIDGAISTRLALP
jgi:hypothetical protein